MTFGKAGIQNPNTLEKAGGGTETQGKAVDPNRVLNNRHGVEWGSLSLRTDLGSEDAPTVGFASDVNLSSANNCATPAQFRTSETLK